MTFRVLPIIQSTGSKVKEMLGALETPFVAHEKQEFGNTCDRSRIAWARPTRTALFTA
jgi:hypothetical protein